MANLKISQLTAGNPAAVGDQIPINRSGTNFSITADSVSTWNFLQNAAGALTLANAGNATTFNQTSAVGWTWANTTPTVTGTATSLALSTVTPPSNAGGNSWVYTLSATETGAGTNGWAGALVTLAGFTGGATGNNGTNLAVTASTTTTVTITNATGTATNTGTPTIRSTSVSNSPIINVAGTVNTGGAGALASVADNWTIQNVIGTVVPNPVSTLTVAHSAGTNNAQLKLSSNVGASVASGITLNNGSTAFSATAGTQRGVLVSETFTAASGAAVFNALEVDLAVGSSAGTGVLTGINVALTGDGTYGSPTYGLFVSGDNGTYFQVQGGSVGVTAVTGRLSLQSATIIDSTGTATPVALQALYTNQSSGVSWGVPLKLNLTAQSAAISATTILAVPGTGAGMYRISYVASVTTAGTTSSLGGAAGFQVTYTDKNDSVVKTSNPTTPTISAGNTTATTISGVVNAYCKASTNLQYAFGYTSTGTAMVYDLNIYVEYLGA